ncbi:hypothetical protein GCM10023310_69970 [Paenibacillus vulneris]|uniref:DUF262 domain-containing protein n=1 Tax=Paenibacillus vulneris TaxID=1133364 RepID=A0ABW3UG67_9BACL
MARGKKKVELTPEELQNQSLARELRDLTECIHLIPEPREILQTGTQVRIGALEDVMIEEVLMDGKVYKIDYTSVNTNYGNPIRNEHQKRFVKWLDVRKMPQSDVQTLCKRDDLQLSYSNRHMGDIFSKAYHFGIDFDPDYQREHVWSLEDKVSLIDSIYNNIDIGKFVYVHLGYSVEKMYEILDGKQRIRAILDFYEDKFPYNGLYFSEMTNRDQDHFENYPISCAEVREATRAQKLRYFIKLNTGGRIMSTEHLDKVRLMLNETE